MMKQGVNGYVVNQEDVIIIGAGPCGLSAALYLKKEGYNPLVLEKGNIVQSIFRYPTHQQFFSSSDKLEIGDMPFVIEDRKPKRNQALAYYREVVNRNGIRVRGFERVAGIVKKTDESGFLVHTERTIKSGGEHYRARFVIIATGYYDSPNMMNIPGERLPKVYHYFKEAHPFFDCDVVVIGGKNSAIDTAMECQKAGSRVTVLYRGDGYSKSIKPWILPEFESLVRHGKVAMLFNTEVREIRENAVVYSKDGRDFEIRNDIVFAMTGYHPDHAFLQQIGVNIVKETGCPVYDPESMETNVPGVFIAGVIAAGNDANTIFIENGRFHGEKIARAILRKARA